MTQDSFRFKPADAEWSPVQAEHAARIAALKAAPREKLKEIAAALAIEGGRAWSEFSFLEILLLHRHAVLGAEIPAKSEMPVTPDDSPEGVALNERIDALGL